MEKRGNRGNFPQFPRFLMCPCQQGEFRLDRQNEFGFHQKGGLCGKGPGIGIQPGASGFLQPLHGGKQVIPVAAECLAASQARPDSPSDGSCTS